MKTKKKIFLLVFSILTAGSITCFAQDPGITLNETGLPDSALFDFWIGEWDLWWNDSDNTVGTGKNVVMKILNNKVISENFIALSGNLKGFEGNSYSLLDLQSNQWKQTWVDTDGSYLDFYGKTENDKRIFGRSYSDPYRKMVIQRMVFYDIAPDTFTWNWEISFDKGNNWELLWQIHYEREK